MIPIHCKSCQTSTPQYQIYEAVSFVCPNCQMGYKNRNGNWETTIQYQNLKDRLTLKLAQEGNFFDKKFYVNGSIVKKTAGNFYWTEYVLRSVDGSIIYLSECDGHWILLEEIDYPIKVVRNPVHITYQNSKYQIFEKSRPNVVAAQGIFDFDISKEFQLIEYINPPFMLSVEKLPNEQTVYFGKHISQSAIKKAFGTMELPSKSGIGMVQPFLIHFKSTVLVFCFITIMMLLTHLYWNQSKNEVPITNTVLNFTKTKDNAVSSQSFEIKENGSELNFEVSSDIDNNWANISVGLINELTNEEVYANKDMEYYSGYTDGESWREGSQTEKFTLCAIPKGKYHLVMTPLKDSADIKTEQIMVQTILNKHSYYNIKITVIMMLILLLILFLFSRFYEINRWSNSDYSPYNDNE
ncbi:DUF4178 domain-containing protein [Flavobacterium branchiophilum]|uniref:DUF4178 domain-containing protein n=1 Tax=Flavobacterium branchiophilum TaxID=55197 RepID=A0A2H3KJ60_9FLAO|nr:DUF4178 domain-containing protein [Flavobacterium branchiophilum]PDS22087.1 hypothetical protein B0A77_14240 [Flavobacterium branchiophilum]